MVVGRKRGHMGESGERKIGGIERRGTLPASRLNRERCKFGDRYIVCDGRTMDSRASDASDATAAVPSRAAAIFLPTHAVRRLTYPQIPLSHVRQPCMLPDERPPSVSVNMCFIIPMLPGTCLLLPYFYSAYLCLEHQKTCPCLL
jgi:hypothetical protein